MSQELGQVIREARERAGWSQNELARRIEVSSGFITKIEKNQALPSYECLVSLADALALNHELLFAIIEEAKAKRNALRIRAKGASVRRLYGWASRRPKNTLATKAPQQGDTSDEELAQAVLANEDLRRAVGLIRTALENPETKPKVLTILEMLENPETKPKVLTILEMLAQLVDKS